MKPNVGGRPKNPPKPKKLLKEIIPVHDLFEEDELDIYNSIIDIFLQDFDADELSSADIDDIMCIATNKIIEIRLLKTAKGDPDRHIDTSQAIEKIRKQTETMKTNLSTRRKDRVDPNQYKGFSIVDLAVAFDQEKRSGLEEKIQKLKEEQKQAAKKYKDHPGNRYDVDATKRDDMDDGIL